MMKALKPKQKVAIDAPTRISSKLVRCSITFCIWWELVRLPLPLVSSAELLNYFLVKFNNLGIPINTKILDIFLNDGFLSLCQGIN